jgi:predicted transposase YbfD/YdcC
VRRGAQVLPTTPEESGFPHAQSIVRTTTTYWGKGNPKLREETREWISSLSVEEASAQRFGELVRGHWDIENGSHRQRDVLWGEDRQRMKNHTRAHVLATLRQIGLHINRRQQQERQHRTQKPQAISQQVQSTQRNLARAITLIINPW